MIVQGMLPEAGQVSMDAGLGTLAAAPDLEVPTGGTRCHHENNGEDEGRVVHVLLLFRFIEPHG